MDNNKLLTHASLFSGIGGFDLAAEWAGFQNIFHCDYDTFCRQVLDYQFPNSDSYADITQTDFTPYRGHITVLSGGFPCQPFSLAGKRKGADDARYLWPQMLRAIQEIRPTWIIGENVVGITSMVFPGEKLRVASETIEQDQNTQATETTQSEFVIERICCDLEQAGYTVQPFIIPACSVGAPHKRDRVWIVARLNEEELTTNTSRIGCNDGSSDRQERHLPNHLHGNAPEDKQERSRWQCRTSTAHEVMGSTPDLHCERCHEDGRVTGRKEQSAQEWAAICSHTQRPCPKWTATDTRSLGQERRVNPDRPESTVYVCPAGLCPRSSHEQRPIPCWEKFPTQPPLYTRDDGIPLQLANTPFPHSKWRKEAVKSCGNAIVPQVAYELLRHIATIELNHSK